MRYGSSRRLAAVVVAALLAVACGSESNTDEEATEPSTATSAPTEPALDESPAETAAADSEFVASGAPSRVLFVGNSLSYWNDGLDRHMAALAASHPTAAPLEADSHIMGSAQLAALWNGAPEIIAAGDYDVVVLQGAIRIAGVDSYHEYARLFADEIRAAGAEPVLLMVWPDKRELDITLDEIVEANDAIAAELGVTVAPVGLAWERAREQRPDLELYDFDGLDPVHPSIHGTYLTVSVVYAAVSGGDPGDLTYLPDGITEEDAAFLRDVAWQTVADVG